MVDCRLADLNIRFCNQYDRLSQKVADYRADFECPDIEITITEKDRLTERGLDNGENAGASEAFFEDFSAFRLLGNRVPHYDGVVMHGCLIEANRKGILFTARSGTGKTTHMRLWKQMLGNRVRIVNGDKPIVRFSDPDKRIPFGYGTPWNGKENLGFNGRVPLTDVCLIERAETNETTPLSVEEGMELLLRQTYLPPGQEAQLKTLELVREIAGNVRFWRIRCNMELQAATTAYDAIFAETEVPPESDYQNRSMPVVFPDKKIVTGFFKPDFDTDTFELTGLPFRPVKVSVFCADAFMPTPVSTSARVISLQYDSTAKFLAFAVVQDKTTKVFAVTRSMKRAEAFSVDENGFSVRGLDVDGKSCCFPAQKTYTFTVIGE